MNCKYIYKGIKQFDSEYELDGYLLRNMDFIQKFGDIVFLRTEVQNARVDFFSLQELIYKELLRNKKILAEANYSEYVESGEMKGINPYTGVTLFLKEMKSDTSKSGYVTPLFHEDDFTDDKGNPKEGYWSHKIKEWKTKDPKDLTPEEKEILFDVDESGNRIIQPITDELINEAKHRYHQKWLQLAIQGNIVHKIFDIFFSKDGEKGSLIYVTDLDRIKKEVIKILSKTKTRISRDDEPFKEDFMINLIKDNIIDDAILHCIQLRLKLSKKFKNATFLSELNVVGEAYVDGQKKIIVGRLDLVVIDLNGNIHIFDYKTSPKDYFALDEKDLYNKAKLLTFKYQLGIYYKLLQLLKGINCFITTSIIPLQFLDFRRDGNTDVFVYDSLKNSSNEYSLDLTSDILTSPTISQNLNKYFPKDDTFDMSGKSIDGDTYSILLKWFPNYSSERVTKEEKIRDMLKEHGAFNKDPKRNKFIYRIGDKLIEADTEVDLVKKVKLVLDFKKNNIEEQTTNIINQLREAQEANVGDKFSYKGKISTNVEDADWLNRTLRNYASKNYMVLTPLNTENYPVSLTRLGIILLKKITGPDSGTISVIKISNAWLGELFKFGNSNKGLTGNYESDIIQVNKPKELLLEANRGNIEMMETMLALNAIPNLFAKNNTAIESILVINPYHLDGMTASNKELLYNFNELCRLSGYKHNFSIGEDNSPIHMLSFYERAKSKFKIILIEGGLKNFGVFKGAVSALDAAYGNAVEMREKLLQLKELLESEYSELKGISQTPASLNTRPELSLYLDIMYAISELDGYDFRQQVSGHDAFFELVLLKDPSTWSLRGLLLDNPGTLTNDTLNKATTAPRTAYMNVRLHMLNFITILNEKTKALKESKRLNWLLTHITGSEIDYYKNLTYIDSNGDLMFRHENDPSLTKEESEFLKWALIVINARRFNRELDEIPTDQEYYRVPLTRGGNDSVRLSKGGLFGELKNKLENLNPKTLIKRAKERMNGILTSEDRNNIQKGTMWEMTNTFDAGENEEIRKKLINDEQAGGVSRFERNIETLLLKHEFAYESKKLMDKIFPVIKTAMMHMLSGSMIRNLREEFYEDINYLHDYIKSKIFNLSIVDPHKQWIQALSQEVMAKASKMALAFSPHQLYLAFDGLWKDIKVFHQYNDKDNPMRFELHHLKDAFFYTYRDLINSGSSITSKINDLYGINDRDMNVYVNRVKSDLTNFDDFAFRIASRPDFYNRMTIFGAQMRKDGSWEAHSLGKYDKLIYDWTKDKRFDVFVKYVGDETKIPNSLINKYNQQKGLYMSMAELFLSELAIDLNGHIFRMSKDPKKPTPLPRAYTILQAENMKAFGDKLYGYYTHENKSLFQSSLIGSLLMQMNTYWSSKKNQWIGKGGINLQGRMALYEENKYDKDGNLLFILEDGTESTNKTNTPAKQKYWMKLDENGNLTREITTDSTSGVPYMVWQGQYEEGILMTVAKLGRILFFGDDDGIKGWNHAWSSIYNNDDINLRTAYRANLKQLMDDLIMWLLMGIIVVPALYEATKKHCKDIGNEDVLNAFSNTCKLETVRMLLSSFDDADPLESLMGRGVLWTPFAIQTMTRQYNNWVAVLGGKDFEDALVKTFSATKSTEPIWDYVKFNIRGRHIGQKAEE